MGRTFVRQDAQIQPSDLYDDTVAFGSTMETTSATNIEDDLNNLRSQVKRILNDAAGNWYDDVPTINSKKRDLTDLNTDLDDLEEQKFLCRSNNLIDITVGGADNWVILADGSSETPTEVKALVSTTDGAVAALSALTGAGFEVNELTEVTGPDTINPKNMMIIRNAADGTIIQSSGRDVYGLLQVEASSVDGEAFSDTATKRAKLSFVRQTSLFDDLEACPAVDIQGLAINYSYVRRIRFDDFPEDCFLSQAGFVDNVGSVDVTRQNAYDNQGATAVELGTDASLDLNGAGRVWKIRDLVNGDLFSIIEGSTGGTTQFNIWSDVDEYDNDAVDVSFANGIAVGDSGTEISLNETAGQIDRAADLRLKATGSGELYFADSNEPGSWSLDGIKLSENATSWTTFETQFGEVSLLDAIVAAAASSGTLAKTYAIVQSNINADIDVGGPGTAANLDVDLPNLTGWTAADTGDATFVSNNDIYLNGVLLRGGTSAASNHDFYPGTTDEQLKFEFQLKGTGSKPDVICAVTRS